MPLNLLYNGYDSCPIMTRYGAPHAAVTSSILSEWLSVPGLMNYLADGSGDLYRPCSRKVLVITTTYEILVHAYDGVRV